LMAELVQSTGTFVQVLDKNFRFLAINNANVAEYEEVYGFRPKVGDSLAELLADRPELLEPVRAIWSRSLAGEAFTVIEQFGDPTLQRRYYEITSWPLRDAAGEIIGAYQFTTDTTERQQAEARLAKAEEQLRQSQKMEAIGQLTGGLAHDFNNLLAGISGSLDLLQRRLAQGRLADVDHFVQTAQGASRRAATLTQRLLAFSRRQTLDPRAVDLNRVVAGMEELIRRSVGPDVTLEVVGAGGLWLTRVDVPQIESALLNLCLNGRDAMAPNGGRLTIETANRWLDDHAALERDVPRVNMFPCLLQIREPAWRPM
jgi:signal transduction histidine kinase